MVDSKGWDWNVANHQHWIEPTDIVYYLAYKWKQLGYKRILDLGSGLGRHSIFFAKLGFEVYSLEISDYGIEYLTSWNKQEKLAIHICKGDMALLPFENDFFDCVFAYHSISHADTDGTKQIISEIHRVLHLQGEFYGSLCSKASWDYCQSGYPHMDNNTVINKSDGPEYDVAHYYADCEDIIDLFHDFDIEQIRHVDYCYLDHKKQDIKHYYVDCHKVK